MDTRMTTLEEPVMAIVTVGMSWIISQIRQEAVEEALKKGIKMRHTPLDIYQQGETYRDFHNWTLPVLLQTNFISWNQMLVPEIEASHLEAEKVTVTEDSRAIRRDEHFTYRTIRGKAVFRDCRYNRRSIRSKWTIAVEIKDRLHRGKEVCVREWECHREPNTKD